MKLTLLGTCSGTEPMPGRRHVSFSVEAGGGVYWFDAGEGCSYTAHLAGIDLLAVRAIFISHAHIDHIGGLPNLLFNMAKINRLAPEGEQTLNDRVVPIHFPDMDAWQGLARMLSPTLGRYLLHHDLHPLTDGGVFDDDTVKVTAQHSLHLGEPDEGEPWRAFSFRIESNGKCVVFSGDVRDVSELAPLLPGCDVLLMETGHHKVEDICNYLKESPDAPRRLVFIHHGRAILADPERELRKAQAILGDSVTIADDGMVIEL